MLQAFLSWLLPVYCAGCGDPLRQGDWCTLCAVTLVPTREGSETASPATWLYGGALQTALSQWKNSGAAYLRRPLQHLWLSEALPRVRPFQPELIVPIPSSKRALLRRGFNPAGQLAHALARALDCRFQPQALRLQRSVHSAKGMVRAERLTRMKQALKATQVEGKRVLVVDDVMTTGATLFEAKRALEEALASDVMVLAFAGVSET